MDELKDMGQNNINVNPGSATDSVWPLARHFAILF